MNLISGEPANNGCEEDPLFSSATYRGQASCPSGYVYDFILGRCYKCPSGYAKNITRAWNNGSACEKSVYTPANSTGGSATTPDANQLVQFARQLDLDPERFREALSATGIRELIDTDIAQGNDRGLNGQPVLFLNGERYEGNTVPGTEQLVTLLGGDACCTKRSTGPVDRNRAPHANLDIFSTE